MLNKNFVAFFVLGETAASFSTNIFSSVTLLLTVLISHYKSPNDAFPTDGGNLTSECITTP
jgi:hypothetical protein